jgi:hypothetical protein
LAYGLRIFDVSRLHAPVGQAIVEEALIVRAQLPVHIHAGLGPQQPVRGRLVRIGMELRAHALLSRCALDGFGTVARGEAFSTPMQVVGREVRPEVGAMAVDRAILHHAVPLEDVHARQDVLPGKEHLAAWTRHATREWRLILVHEVGEDTKHGEPEQVREHRSLKPTRGNRHCAAIHSTPPCGLEHS